MYGVVVDGRGQGAHTRRAHTADVRPRFGTGEACGRAVELRERTHLNTYPAAHAA